MSIKNICSIIGTLFNIASCTNMETVNDVVINRIEPDTSTSDTIIVNVQDPAIANFMDFVDSVRYICLETKADCPIGEVSDILFTDSVIVVVDKYNAHAVYLFDYNGKYINHVSRRGNGPHDYLSLESSYVTLNHDRSMVVIQDNMRDKCLWYDLAGNFVRTTDMTPGLGNWESLSENSFLHTADFRKGSEHSVFVMTDSIDACLYSMEDVNDNNPFMASALLYHQGSRTVGKHAPDNSIYEFNSGFPKAVCHIEIRPDDISNHKYRNVKAYINATLQVPELYGNVLVMDNAICFKVTVPHDNNNYIFSRMEHELYRIVYDSSNFHSISFSRFITCMDNNWIVSAADPADIPIYVGWNEEKKQTDSKLSALSLSVSSDDNPILVFYRLKDGI